MNLFSTQSFYDLSVKRLAKFVLCLLELTQNERKLNQTNIISHRIRIC